MNALITIMAIKVILFTFLLFNTLQFMISPTMQNGSTYSAGATVKITLLTDITLIA